MRKKYKIQLPKGKKVTMTNVDFENGVMTVNVELENQKGFHKAMHDEVCGVFNEISNQWKEVLKANCITGEKDRKKYEPKDGDFISLKWKCNAHLIPMCDNGNDTIERNAIAIFKEIQECDNISYLFCHIVYFLNDGIDNRLLFLYGKKGCTEYATGKVSMFDKIKPATEEEKKLLIDKLAERNKKWNAETKQIENVRWRAKGFEKYYFVKLNDKNFPILDTFDDSYSDIERYKIGNYFKTKESAERVAKQIREIFKNSKAE